MSFFDWLLTPEGGELTRALILLISAVAAVLSAYAASLARANNQKLDNHVNGPHAEPPAKPRRNMW